MSVIITYRLVLSRIWCSRSLVPAFLECFANGDSIIVELSLESLQVLLKLFNTL